MNSILLGAGVFVAGVVVCLIAVTLSAKVDKFIGALQAGLSQTVTVPAGPIVSTPVSAPTMQSITVEQAVARLNQLSSELNYAGSKIPALVLSQAQGTASPTPVSTPASAAT